MKRTLPKSRLAIALVGTLLAALPLWRAESATITFREGDAIPELGITAYSGAQNLTLISGTSASGNYGDSNSIWVGKGPNGEERKALLRFDVSMLAGQYESIDSVKLTLTLLGESQGNTTTSVAVNTYQIAGANAGWVQGSSKGSAQTGSSSWNYRLHSTASWKGSAGLGTAGVDYLSTVIDGTKAIQSGAATSFNGVKVTWDIPIELFELWVDGDNAGLVLSAAAFESLGIKDLLRFASDSYTSAYRPQLVVQYTPVPEPASMVFVGSFVCLLLANGALRRRRTLV